MIDGNFLKQLNKLSLIINKKITSGFIGNRATRSVGSGLVFGDYATYSLGDDFRSIDWKVYSRTERLYVKRYEQDKNITVHVLVDFSASMAFGEDIKKYEYASRLGLGFVYLAIKNNEKYVFSTFSDKLEFFKPLKGKNSLASMINYLNKKKPKGLSNLWESMSNYRSLIDSISLVVLISDFFYDITQIRNVLYKYKKNEIILIQVLDPIEKNLSLEGDFNLMDLESNSKLRTFITPALRNKYLEKMKLHSLELQKTCDGVKAKFYTISTNEDIFDVFYRILV